MGFTTGLLGGFTLTATVLYLSVQLHTRNRVYQSALLRQQSLVVNNVVDPQPAPPPVPSRAVPAGVWETAKDRWNAELERNVRKLQNTDWDEVRESVEDGVSAVWKRAFQAGEEVVQDARK